MQSVASRQGTARLLAGDVVAEHTDTGEDR
jgi:hypothetical protein